MGKLAALIMLAQTYCPWNPGDAKIEYIVAPENSQVYEFIIHARGNQLPTATWGFTWLYNDTHYIVLREERMSERIICHEWRHVVEGYWHPPIPGEKHE
jgi:hypothetical protein